MKARCALLMTALGVSLGLIGLVFWLSSVSRANASPPYQAGGVDLDYVLTIDNPSSGQAAVTMAVSNLSIDPFEVGYLDPDCGNVLTLSAYDAVGNPLSVEHFPDTWRVQCAGLSQIVIEYTVQPGLIDPGHGHLGYIAPDFAASAGEYVFLVPKNSATHSVTVSFSLPTGWNVYTPWAQQGDSYDPTLLGADIIESLRWTSFALGQFDVYTQTVGATEIAVAAYHGWPTDVKEELAQQSWDIFAYQTSVFDGSVGDYYLAIFCPVALDDQDIYAGEWSTSQGYSIRFEADGSYWGRWSMFAHQIFHRWNAWVWGWDQPEWFDEGSDVLYEMKTITELRIDQPYGGMEDELQRYYNRYLSEYVATGNDRALTAPDLDSFLLYRKTAMVNFLLAKEIYLRTDGTHNFDNFLQVLVQKYSHHAAPCYEECLKAELATLTGTDFTQFFDDYVYGTTTLPMDWAFEDDDIDGLSNALEIGWDTHPEDEDTDDDGYPDGLEVQYGTNPLDPSSVPPDTLIIIGMDAPPSGWIKAAGWRQTNAAQLAVDQTNAAGGVDIGGTTYTVTLVTAHSACDATQAITAANTLLNMGTGAVVGHTCSPASNAAQPLYHAAGVPMVSPSSSWPNVTEQGYTTTFRVCSREDTAAALLATHLRDGLGMEKAAIIELSGFGGGPVATDVFSNTFTSLGGTITSQRMVTSTAEYTATLTAIQAENPEVIFYADNDANAAGLLSTTAHGLGMTDVIIAWDTFSYDESVLDDYAAAAGAAAEGDHAVMHHRRTEDMPGYDDLNAAYQAAGFPNCGDEVTMWGAFAYDAANIVIAAIDRADSTAPADIRNEIAATADYEGVVGTYEGFDAKGDVIPQWHWIERYENGQWVILHPSRIFLPIILRNFGQ